MGRYHHVAYIMPDRRGENVQLLFVFGFCFFLFVFEAGWGSALHKVTFAANVRL